MSKFKLGKFVFCHRRQDRTLKFRGRYFPVCARCTGIYAGFLIVYLLHYFIILNLDFQLLFLSFVLMLPTTIDGTTQLFKWRESRNWIRLVTGFPCGIGYGLLLIYW